MSEWITERKPREDDGPMIYGPDGKVCHYTWIHSGEPWKPIPKCEPYVKPKRYRVTTLTVERWCVIDKKASDFVAKYLPTEEAAERIAAIFEEVMP